MPTRTQRYDRIDRDDDGEPRSTLVWRFEHPMLTIASGPLGGGIGLRRWVVNATVHKSYDRLDPAAHLAEIATSFDLPGAGVGMLTAVDVRRRVTAEDDGVVVVATVGLSHPTWAAAPDGDIRPAPEGGNAGMAPAPSTINIVALLPVPMTPAALVNLVATLTEAKAQALWNCGREATGTATDAVCVACPVPSERDTATIQEYGGPRSTWGSRLARAVHAAVVDGARRWTADTGSGLHRPT